MWGETEDARVGQVFHLLDTVKMVKGCCRTEAGEEEYTLYQACYHEGVCYYANYKNRQVAKVALAQENLEGKELTSCLLE